MQLQCGNGKDVQKWRQNRSKGETAALGNVGRRAMQQEAVSICEIIFVVVSGGVNLQVQAGIPCREKWQAVRAMQCEQVTGSHWAAQYTHQPLPLEAKAMHACWVWAC